MQDELTITCKFRFRKPLIYLGFVLTLIHLDRLGEWIMEKGIVAEIV